jgi:amidase
MIRVMLVSALLAPAALAAQDTVRYTPTVQQPTFAVREPVLRIRPGTVLVSRTHFGPYHTEAGGVWRLDTTRMVGVTDMPRSRVKRMEIDLQPMLGRVAVAPRGQEAFSGLWPGDFGGNMDAQEVRQGTTVYLPIFHDGAFYFGDGHARQGYGEVAGTGLETSMDVVLRIDVVKGRTIDWPRLEDAEHIMVVGSARPLIDAFRLAHVELIDWMVEEHGFERLDAYTLVGQVGESTVANIVDPAYSVVAKIRKRYLGGAGR